MDNLTHSLCGAALARTRLGRMHRLAPVSLLVAANLPDVDIVSGLFGQQSYLLHHRGFTHSVLGALLLALLLTGVMRLLERNRVDAPRRWRAYLLPALIGVATHPLLDLLNNYGLRPWLPFDDTRYFGDLVFIVDPWLWLLFGGVALLAGRRSPTVDFACGAVGVAATAFFWWSGRAPAHVRVAYLIVVALIMGLVRVAGVGARRPGFLVALCGLLLAGYVGLLFASWRGSAPAHVRVAFPIGVALIVVMRKSGVGVRRPQLVLEGGGVLVAAYLGLLLSCRTVAIERAVARPDRALSSLQADGAAPRLAMCSPAIADPFHWGLCFEGGSGIVWRTVGLDGRELAGADDADLPLLQPFDDPLVKAAMRSDAAAPWRDFTRVPWGWVERHSDGSARVGLSDARYQRLPGKGWCSVEVDFTTDEVKQVMESDGAAR